MKYKINENIIEVEEIGLYGMTIYYVIEEKTKKQFLSLNSLSEYLRINFWDLVSKLNSENLL